MRAAGIARADGGGDARRGDVAVGHPPDLQLDVLREMLATMDTLTESGQRYTMNKIVVFIRSRSPSNDPRFGLRESVTISHLLGLLEGDATGLVVHAERFVVQAVTLLDLLDAPAARCGVQPSARRAGRWRGAAEQPALNSA